MKTKTWLILIAVLTAFTLLFYWLWQNERDNRIIAENKPHELTAHYITVTNTDTIEKQVKIPVPYKVETIIHDTVIVDSAKVVSDWNKKRSYHPVLLDDSTGYIAIDLSVYQNRLSYLDFTFVPRITKEFIPQPYPEIKYVKRDMNEIILSLGYYGEMVPGIGIKTRKGIFLKVGYGLGTKSYYGEAGIVVLKF